MADGFERLSDDLDNFFGLGPLFGLVGLDDEEENNSRKMKRNQWTLIKPGDNHGPGLGKIPGLARNSAAARQNRNDASQAGGGYKYTGISNSVSPTISAQGPATIFAVKQNTAAEEVAGLFQSALYLLDRIEEEEEKHRGHAGGTSSTSRAVGLAKATGGASRMSSKAGAARAAVASGAQPAVFKVISTQSSTVSARALIEYLGRREDEGGQKHDIPIETEDGRTLGNWSERRDYIEEFSQGFREGFTNFNFLEIEITLQGVIENGSIKEALTNSFGVAPFIYARNGSIVRAYGYTQAKSADINEGLSVREQGANSMVLERIEKRFTAEMERQGLGGSARVKASSGTEKSGKYFLQKFMRQNSNLYDSAGEQLKVAKRVDKSANRIFSEWKPALNTRQVRNAYHLVFSARAGTNADAVLSSAKAVLDQLAPGHSFVVAHHSETGHVHVHAMVSAVSKTGERLNFRKADLYNWRETYAEKMQERGVEMVATQRMDMASSRPFNMRHAGAVERNRKDSRYQIRESTRQRVANKKAQIIEPLTATAHGTAIASSWRDTAAVLYGLDAPQQAIGRAQEFANVVLSFDDNRKKGRGTGESTKSSGLPKKEQDTDRFFDIIRTPEMQSVYKLIGEMAMAQTPLEIHQKISQVNASMDNIRKTLPHAEQIQFDEVREQIQDQMRERLAKAHVEQQASSRLDENSQPVKSVVDDGKQRGSHVMRELAEARAAVDYYRNHDQERLAPDGERSAFYESDLREAGRRADAALKLAVSEAEKGNSYILASAKNDPELSAALDAARNERQSARRSQPNEEQQARQRYGDESFEKGAAAITEYTASQEALKFYRNQTPGTHAPDGVNAAYHQNDLQVASERAEAAIKAVTVEVNSGNKYVQEIVKNKPDLQKAIREHEQEVTRSRFGSDKHEKTGSENSRTAKEAQGMIEEPEKPKAPEPKRQEIRTNRNKERDYER